MARLNKGGYANRKIVQVPANMGIQGVQNMQGTTRSIYDSLPLVTSSSAQTLRFFENVNTRQFPFTNITENKLQVGEQLSFERFSLALMWIAPTGEVAEIEPFARTGFSGLYRSDLNFSIAQDQVIKRLPIHTMFAPFNKDSQFYGNHYFQLFGGVSSVGIPQDIFHMDNPIIIPQQIEFVAEWKIPPITVTPPQPGYVGYVVMTISGLGSLFAPKSTY